MALATLSTTIPIRKGSGMVQVFRIEGVGNTYTYVWDTHGATAAIGTPIWWIENISSAAKVTATYSTGTFTFACDSGTPNIDLFIAITPEIQR